MAQQTSAAVVADRGPGKMPVVTGFGSRLTFSDDFVRGFEAAAGSVTGLKRTFDLHDPIKPGKDVDVLVERFDAACAYLERNGFIASVLVPQNPDNRLYSFYHQGLRTPPIQIHLYRKPCWGRAWRWSGRLSREEAKWIGSVLEKRSFDHVEHVTEVWRGRSSSTAARRFLEAAVTVRSRPLVVTALCLLGLRLSPSALMTSIAMAMRRRYWQLRHRIGVEIGFAGVDGSGKSSLVDWLEKQLCAPVQSMYMGSADYVTVFARYLDRRGYRGRLWPLIERCDQAVRRLFGIVAAKRARIVLYDRDPNAVQGYTGSAWKRALMRPFEALLGRPVDMAVFLDGDLEVFHRRKGEHDPERLGELRSEIVRSYQEHGVVPWSVDSAAEGVDSIGEKVAERISDLYLSRLRALADYVYGRHPAEGAGANA